MDHLDEMPGTVRSGMDIAMLGARIAAVAARRALRIAEPRRQRLEDRIETIDDGFVAADHQAIAALETPHAAARADVDAVDVALFQHLGAADVVLPKRVAAVEHDVAWIEQLAELPDRVLRDLTRGQHDPDRARRPQLRDELVEALGALGAVAANGGDRLWGVIIEDHLVTVLNQAARNIAAHAPEANHADLHGQRLRQDTARSNAAASSERPVCKSPPR